jgi:hypothetical protein
MSTDRVSYTTENINVDAITSNSITSNSGNDLTITSSSGKDLIIDALGSGKIIIDTISPQGLIFKINQDNNRVDQIVFAPNGDLLQNCLCLGSYFSSSNSEYHPYVTSQKPNVSNEPLFLGTFGNCCVFGANYNTATNSTYDNYSFFVDGGNANFNNSVYVNKSLLIDSSKNITGASITGTGNINSSAGALQTNSITRIDNSGNVTAGTISGSTITGSGNINSTGGALQTNSITRIDNSGNVTAGTISGSTITGSGNINSSGGALQTNSITRIDNSGNVTAGTINGTVITSSTNYNTSGSAGYQVGGVTVIDNSRNVTGGTGTFNDMVVNGLTFNGITSSELSVSGSNDSTSSTTFVTINGMSTTPGVGLWLVNFSSSISQTDPAATTTIALFFGDTEFTKTEQNLVCNGATLSVSFTTTFGNPTLPMSVRWKVSSGSSTATIYNRILNYVRIQ